VANHWERSCQSAAVWLRGSRDSEHKKDDNSFGLDSIATEFYRGICRYMKDIIAKGFIKYTKDQWGTLFPSAAAC